MAEWYCDPSLVQAAYADYATAPTAAGTVPTKPEDGNGKAAGVASMATLVVTFTGQPAADEAITIGGVTFTAKASGATGNQFNIGASAAATATNLRNAINASTTNVVNPTMNSCPLRNAVNATDNGAGVVTVYTRICGSEWNAVTETENLSNVTITSQWAGGADGAWGWFFNVAAIAWPTSVAVGAYGGFASTYLGLPAAGDTLHVRTGRSNNDITLTGFGSASITVNSRDIGTVTSYFEVRFDDGTVWAGTANKGQFTIDKSATGGTLVVNVRGCTWWRGQMKSGTDAVSGGTVNTKVRHSATDTGGWTTTINLQSTLNSKHSVVEGLELEDTGAGTFANTLVRFGLVASAVGDPNRPIKVSNCKLGFTRAGTALFNVSGAFGSAWDVDDCLFAGGGATYTRVLADALPTTSFTMRLRRPKFTGGGGGHHALIPWTSTQYSNAVLVIEDPIDMGQFIASDSAASCCGTVAGGTSGTAGGSGFGQGQFMSSNVAERPFLIDEPRRLVEWRLASFPTTGLTLTQDNVPVAWRFSLPHTGLSTGLATRHAPARCVKQTVLNTLGDDDLTLTQHLLIDSSYGGSTYTPTDTEWWIEGTYVSAADGSTKRFSTRGTGSNLAADTQSWSSLSFSPFAGASRTFSRWKITAALLNVKDDTDVTIQICCAKQPSTMNEWAFVDPQFELAPT